MLAEAIGAQQAKAVQVIASDGFEQVYLWKWCRRRILYSPSIKMGTHYRRSQERQGVVLRQ